MHGPCFFFNGQHDFLRGERVKRKGGEKPLLELLCGLLRH